MLPHVNKQEEKLEESELSYDIKRTKKIKWQHQILLNRPLKVVISFVLLAVVAPLLIYRFLFFTSIDLPPSDGFSFGSCLIARQSRLPCGYGDVNPDQCHSECCYDQSNKLCFHRFPSRFSYILNQEWSEEVFLTSRISTVPYGAQESFTNIRLSIDEISATHLSLSFYKSDEQITGRKIEEKKYVYEVSQDELNIIVNGPQGNIFTTARGPLIASNDIWEIAFKITNETMYGLGEIPLKEDTIKVIYSHRGGLNSMPLIFAKANGSYHGLLLDAIAPTEIHIRNGNQLVVRSITNWGFKFHLFLGPEPVDIMRDVMELIGSNKTLEYWVLGTHVCSESTYSDSLSDLQAFITAARAEAMPFESHCGSTPVVFNTNCDNDYVKLIEYGRAALRTAGKKFVPRVSPYIRYTEPEIFESQDTEEDSKEDTQEVKKSIKSNVVDRCFDEEEYKAYIIRDIDAEQIYIGSVNDQDVIYVNYNNISKDLMEQLWLYGDFDGIILENNWPLDESTKMVNETRFFLPYFSENFAVAFEQTPQWNATKPERYLYTHNLYGNEFYESFKMIKEDVPFMSTSQWMNRDVIVNRQGIETSWSSLQKEIVEASLGGISGQWYWSSPVCGDTETFDNSTQVKLCAKWYMAATYFPMVQIFSKDIRRDPLVFDGTNKAHMITALRRRMVLMPYFYTVLQEGPLLRPMFYQFPNIDKLSNLTSQFSVGDNLLIVPNLQPSQSHVHVWLPPGQWYEFWSGLKIVGEVGEAVTMTTTEADFLTLIRGGSIITKQEDTRLTVAETQLMSAYVLVIALQCEIKNITEINTKTITSNESDTETTTTDDSSTATESTSTLEPILTLCEAKGKLHMTSDMIILYEADDEMLTITAIVEDFDVLCNAAERTWSSTIQAIKIYGLDNDQNNFDNHRHLQTNINLCSLESEKEITFKLT